MPMDTNRTLKALIFFLVTVVTAKEEFGQPVRNRHSNDDWDYLMFVQEWPQSSCEYANVTGKACSIPSGVKGFTIHGIWPTKGTTRGPNYCDSDYPFDESQIKDLEPQLINQWPNLFTDQSKTSFWKHEWEKHGTCAENLDALKGEQNFFKAALYFNTKYDILSTLAKSGITPSSDGYQSDDINAALEKEYKAKVCPGCRYEHDLGQLYWNTVVCLNKNLTIIDCPECEYQCRPSEPVIYHPIHFGQN